VEVLTWFPFSPPVLKLLQVYLLNFLLLAEKRYHQISKEAFFGQEGLKRCNTIVAQPAPVSFAVQQQQAA
jgi:hypothetical protein